MDVGFFLPPNHPALPLVSDALTFMLPRCVVEASLVLQRRRRIVAWCFKRRWSWEGVVGDI